MRYMICLLLMASGLYAGIENPPITIDSSGSTISVTNTPNMQIVDADGDAALVTSDGQLHTVMMGKLDTNNNTTATLGANNSYTGTSTDVSGYSAIAIIAGSDVRSATNGLNVEYSPDGSDWHLGESYTITAGSTKFFTPPVWSQYYRIVYTNGPDPQSSFFIHPTLKKAPIKWSSHAINEAIAAQDDAELVKSVLTGQMDDGTFDNVGITDSGNLRVANVEDGLSIAKGDVTGHSVVHKFGNAPDFDTGDGEINIWDGADDGESWENMVYDYSSVADIDRIVSASNDTQSIEIQGLGADTNFVVQAITLQGTNPVALATNLYRVFRMKNDNSTDLTGHVFVYTNNPVTDGVPDDADSIRAMIQPENNQTEMALYTIPSGKTGYMRSWYVTTAGGSRSSAYIMKLYAREPGGVFQLKHRSSIFDTATSHIQFNYVDPIKFTEGTDIEMTIESEASPAALANAVAGGFDIVLVDN